MDLLLSAEEEMQINEFLAKEFIESHLNIPVTDNNIQALALFISDLERQ